MQQDHYEQITKMIHFSDPMQEFSDDSLKKLLSFLNSLSFYTKNIYKYRHKRCKNDNKQVYKKICIPGGNSKYIKN